MRAALVGVIVIILSGCVVSTGGVKSDIDPVIGFLARHIATEVCLYEVTYKSQYQHSDNSTSLKKLKFQHTYVDGIAPQGDREYVAYIKYKDRGHFPDLNITYNRRSLSAKCNSSDRGDAVSIVLAAFTAVDPNSNLPFEVRKNLDEIIEKFSLKVSIQVEGRDDEIKGIYIPDMNSGYNFDTQGWLAATLPNGRGVCIGEASTKYGAAIHWNIYCSDGVNLFASGNLITKIRESNYGKYLNKLASATEEHPVIYYRSAFGRGSDTLDRKFTIKMFP